MPRKQEDNGLPSGVEEAKNDSVNSENEDSTFSHESESDCELLVEKFSDHFAHADCGSHQG